MKVIRFGHEVPKDGLKQVALNDGLPKGTRLQEPVLSHCLLRDKHLKGVSFVGGRIKHCRFEHSNLRDARFERVDLTGSVFLDCNLQHAKFTQCKLWYVAFHRCALDYDSLLLTAPEEPNLKKQLLQSLRTNATSLGDTRRATKLLVLELAADRAEYFNIAVGASDYYRLKYSGIERLGAMGSLISWWTQKLLWGHGLALTNVALSGLATVLFFAMVCHWTPALYAVRGEPAPRQLSFLEAIYYSLMSFTTGGFGDIMPGDAWSRTITSVEGLVGVVFLAFFAAAAYRRLAR